MNTLEFKKLFDNYANLHGFDRIAGVWFKQSKECIIVLHLQKSNYSNKYQLMIKIYVQALFGKTFSKSKQLVTDGGHIFRVPGPKYNSAFDLESNLNTNQQMAALAEVFSDFIVPFTEQALSIQGLISLELDQQLYILPSIKQALG